MPFSSSVAQKSRRRTSRRPFCHQDLIMFEALTGKRAELPARSGGIEAVANTAAHSDVAPIQTVARRWKPNMSGITGRIRSMYENGVDAAVKQAHVPAWLRKVSEQAFTAIDEAQARLHSHRPIDPASDGVSPVILSIRPEDITDRRETATSTEPHYKRVA